MALKSGRKSLSEQTNSNVAEEQYLAGKSLTFWESMCSVIATEVSALTFLGIPAIAYAKDYSFLQIYLGGILGRIVIGKIILPKIYNKELTIYGTMAKTDGTENGLRLTSILYSTNKFLAVGVRLFSGSILVAEFFNLNIYIAVFIICFITFFYTLIGGLKAVVRTDMAQMGLFILGGVVAHILIPEIGNDSWGAMMSNAFSAGKMNILDFSNPTPFIIGFCGGFLFDIATHGVDQDFVQRLTANKNMKTAQNAIMFSIILSIFVGLLFLSVGSLLWDFYQSHPLPIGIKNDQLFAYFITKHFPIGVRGLMVAGVLAATMSTLDSTINALSSCFYNDILTHRDPKKIKVFYKVDILVTTVILMLVAFVASTSDGILMLGLKIASWTGGPLLSLLFSTVIWKKSIQARLSVPSVIGAYAFGIGGVTLNTFILEGSWHWNVYLGFALSTIFLFNYSRLVNKQGSK